MGLIAVFKDFGQIALVMTEYDAEILEIIIEYFVNTSFFLQTEFFTCICLCDFQSMSVEGIF